MSLLAVAPNVSLAYEVVGEGAPIVLVHGFASNRWMNWRTPGWYHTLRDVQRQVIALDVRGHGESAKPHDRALYEEGLLAGDVVRLLDHLNIETADVMGYSMGGFITMRLLHDSSLRIRRAVIAGVGENYYARGMLETDAIAQGLRAGSVDEVKGTAPRMFRLFAEQGKNDLEALALCMTRDRKSFGREDMKHVETPVLMVLGEKDTVTGSAGALAGAMRDCLVVNVPNRDHMTTVGDKIYKAAVLEFLSGV